MNEKAFIHVEACELRSLDTQKIEKYLIKNGYQIVDYPENADIIILVTCAFSEAKAKNALNNVKKYQKYNAKLIVAGCLPEINGEELSKIFNGKTISTKDLDKNPKKFEEIFPNITERFEYISDCNNLYENLGKDNLKDCITTFIKKAPFLEKLYHSFREFFLRLFFYEHSTLYLLKSRTLFLIRVAWGCKGNCSYCAITNAIGKLHSKPLDQCLQEFKDGLNKGYKKFILTADDVGAYGEDIQSDFPSLLDRMTSVEGDYRILVLGLHPRYAVKYADDIERLLKRKKIVSLNIPIQSGNHRILKLMHRYSDTEKMKETFLRFRKSDPDIALETDIILGFPTQTFQELKKTLNFIEEIGFNSGLIYPFSSRPGTVAENIEPKITPEEITRRVNYSKKFLKKLGYRIIFSPQEQFIMFDRESKVGRII